MALTGELKIEGLKELNKELKKLDAQMEKRIAKQAVRAGATVIAKEIRRRAPRKTGRLKKSIGMMVPKSARNQIRIDIGIRDRGKETPFYAHMIEFGTSGYSVPKARKKDALLADGKTVYGRKADIPPRPARPFFRPAFDEKARDAFEAIKQKINQLLKTV